MESFIREKKSKAILQTDLSALERYRLLTKQKLQEQSEIEHMKKDIIELKATVKNIIGQLNG